MIDIKTIYYDLGAAVKGICDKVYPRSRPKSVDSKINSYIVVYLPSEFINNEIDDEGRYSDYTTTIQFEVYVRDSVSASNPNGFEVAKVSEIVKAVQAKFPIMTDNISVRHPRITMQTDDGDGFSVTIIQGSLRTK